MCNQSWNGTVPAGGRLTLGFIGGWSGPGTVPAPSGSTLNGVTCTVDGAAATTTTTAGVTTTSTTTTLRTIYASTPFTSLPLTSATELLADPVTGSVYVSSKTDDVVVVTDRDGTLLTTLTGLDGASGLVVLDGTLYVALQGPARSRRSTPPPWPRRRATRSAPAPARRR